MSKFKRAVSRMLNPGPPEVVRFSGGDAAQGYMICTTRRSGSNFFCQLLESTGQLGKPREYFNYRARRTIDGDPSYPSKPREQIARILTDGATSNGIYGSKAFVSQYLHCSERVDIVRSLPKLRFIFLRRQDLIGQAISLVMATQTRQFRSSQVRHREPSYSRKAIDRAISRIVRDNAAWTLFFARFQLNPLELTYEDICADPAGSVQSVGTLFDLPRVGDAVQADLAIQRSELSDQWRMRFLNERSRLFTLEKIR